MPWKRGRRYISGGRAGKAKHFFKNEHKEKLFCKKGLTTLLKYVIIILALSDAYVAG